MKAAGICFAIIVGLQIILTLSGIGLIGFGLYIAWHFISKYW